MTAVLIASLAAGAAIGAVGVGGVLVAPLLVLVAGYEPHVAVATASFSFLFTGAVGSVAYLRRGTVATGTAARLAVAVVPAAIAGAWVAAVVPARGVTLVLAAFVAAAAVDALRPRRRGRGARTPSSGSLALIGIVVGFASAFTGTGGPVVLVPLLLMAGVPALSAIGVAQVVQVPVAVAASAGHAAFGTIDVGVGVALGVVQAIGVLMGARAAHALPPVALRRLVAAALLVTAALLGIGLA